MRAHVGVTRHRLAAAALTAFAVFGSALADPVHREMPPVAAYEHGKLTIYGTGGKIVRSVEAGPIHSFGLSATGDQVAIAGGVMSEVGGVVGVSEYGGAIEVRDVRSWQVRSRVPAKRLPEGELEVYANPAFSPDGMTILVAVHSFTEGAADDAFTTSGPLAVFPSSGGQLEVVKSTAEGVGNPTSPRWSPDGTQIAFGVGEGIGITSVHGISIERIRTKVFTFLFDWIGPNDLIVGLAEEKSADLKPQVLSRRGPRTPLAAKSMLALHGIPLGNGYVEASGRFLLVVFSSGSKLIDLDSGEVVWKSRSTMAHIGRVPVDH